MIYIQVWFLTIWLLGNPVPVVDSDEYYSESDCKAEGARQVRDYQAGNIQAHWECEMRSVPTTTEQEST